MKYQNLPEQSEIETKMTKTGIHNSALFALVI